TVSAPFTIFDRLLLCCLENAIDRRRQPLPVIRLVGKLLFSRSSQLVVLRLAIVLGAAPFGFDQALLFEPVQRRVQRSLVDDQHVFGHLLYALRDSPAVHWAKSKRLK